jgi:hypothetical protein
MLSRFSHVHEICYVHDIVNIGHSVNMREWTLTAMERQLAQALRVLLDSVSWLREWTVEPARGHWDLYASGPIPGGGRALLCVECKNNFTPSQFSGLVERAYESHGYRASTRVLAMPRISPRLAELCSASGWSWFDLAGNCRLELDGVLLIERKGQELVRPAPQSRANLGTPEASRVIRALLVPEHAGQRWTQREMVKHFERLTLPVGAPSLALVNKIVQHLRDQAFIETLGSGGFRVIDYEGLLKAWRNAYRFDRHDREKYFTLLKPKTLEERLRSIDNDSVGYVAYAAFSAADIQAPAVRQPRTWVYVCPVDTKAYPRFSAALEAKPVDSGENVVVLLTDDLGVFYQAEVARGRLPATNAVQTYVDLAHASGRGEEAAEVILERRLRPVWAAAAR